MATIISLGEDTVEPQAFLQIASEQAAQNIVHPILGRANPDVTLRPAGLRTGSVEMGFYGPTAEADSERARALFASPGVFTLASNDRETYDMQLIPSGRIVRELEDTSRDAWLVRFDYTEVAE